MCIWPALYGAEIPCSVAVFMQCLRVQFGHSSELGHERTLFVNVANLSYSSCFNPFCVFFLHTSICKETLRHLRGSIIKQLELSCAGTAHIHSNCLMTEPGISENLKNRKPESFREQTRQSPNLLRVVITPGILSAVKNQWSVAMATDKQATATNPLHAAKPC